MPKVENLSCSLCGTEHGYSAISELVDRGWFVDGVSKRGTSAKGMICPQCLRRILGRTPKTGELQVPEF